MRKPKYTNEFLLEEAKKYSSSAEWYKDNPKTYNIAVKRKLIHELKKHMKKKSTKRKNLIDVDAYLFMDPIKEKFKFKRYLKDDCN